MTQKYDIKWLIERFENGDELHFTYFWGHTNKYNETVGKFCFSQWFESPFKVECKFFKTSEQWMMAQKALLFNDKKAYQNIIAANDPAEAKDIGRKVEGFEDQLWNEKRFEIVKNGNIHKFNQNRAFGDYLLKTGESILVEASPVDTIWGVGLSQESQNINNIYTWRGLNLLGFALMEVRDFLKEFGYFEPLKNNPQTPWTKFPGIDNHDLFWRMGKGEEQLTEFLSFFDSLSHREKIIFALTNPEPFGWRGFYD